jgi:hypothetical protein
MTGSQLQLGIISEHAFPFVLGFVEQILDFDASTL